MAEDPEADDDLAKMRREERPMEFQDDDSWTRGLDVETVTSVSSSHSG